MLEEEEVEEEEEEEEEERSRPGPPPPVGPQKHPLSSTSSHSSLSLTPWRKKTRDLPNIYNCHSCGLRFPDKGRREKLQTLDSQWRIVLLCKECLRSIRSAEVCSYCFSKFGEGGEGSINCRKCSCRVHISCVPEQRGYLAPSEIDPDFFTCVDCCPFPRSWNRKPSNFREACSVRVSTVSLEDVVRDAKCAAVKRVDFAVRARERALVKAVTARRAANLARNALGLFVFTEKQPPTHAETVVPDEELALQLHRAMNGSQRISRNLCPVSSDRLIDAKRGHHNGNFLGRQSESGSHSICGNVELCTEDMFFETMEIFDAKPLDCIGASVGDASLNLDMRRGRYQKKEITEHSKDNPAEMPAKEEQASCSDKVLDSTGDDNSVDSVSASCHRPSESNSTLSLSKDSGGDGEDSFAMQQQKMCSAPDRYLKKYSKRPPSLKAMKHRKGNHRSASALVSCWPMSCSNASRTLADAPYQSPPVPLHGSAFASGSSGCKS